MVWQVGLLIHISMSGQIARERDVGAILSAL
jgi:hypothetical protein